MTLTDNTAQGGNISGSATGGGGMGQDADSSETGTAGGGFGGAATGSEGGTGSIGGGGFRIDDDASGANGGSTLSGNSAGGVGGAIHTHGNLTLINSTLSGNSAAQGGGIFNGLNSQAIIINSTIVLNKGNFGGGMQMFGLSATFHNSIVAGNTETDGVTPSDLSNFIGGTYNLIGDPGSSGNMSHGSNGNIVGDGQGGVLALSTILNTTLAPNGGPTKTHALIGGSPALNKGDDTKAQNTDGQLAFDQRGSGFGRFVSTVDIGAFELQSDVTNIEISDGSGLAGGVVDGVGTQHSSVRRIVIDLASPIAGLANGATFKVKSDNIALGDRVLALDYAEGRRFWVFVSYEAVSGGSRLVLTFSRDGQAYLEDGNYLLRFVSGFTGAPEPLKFHRLFGDIDGDHDVDSADRAAFDAAYRSREGAANYRNYFDLRGDGDVDRGDRDALERRFLKLIDVDGDTYQLKIGGSFSVVTSIADNDDDGRGELAQVVISNTDPARSKLTVNVSKARNGNGLVNIASITGAGLKSLSAAEVVLQDGDMNLTGPLGTLELHSVVNSSIHVPSVREAAVRAFLNSTLFAGYDPDDDNDPMAGGAFTAGGLIDSFKAAGIRGLDFAFANSTIAAERIGSVTLDSVDTSNGGNLFGILAEDAIERVRVSEPRLRFDDGDTTPLTEDDFQVDIDTIDLP